MPNKIAKVVIQFPGAVCQSAHSSPVVDIDNTVLCSIIFLVTREPDRHYSEHSVTAVLGSGQVHMRDRRRYHLAARACGKFVGCGRNRSVGDAGRAP